ncbi:response regulator [Defluviitalea raffinosedens]|uniref:response regulator n=1 Tax=Defluviitalea raffinosedens TaxID=1450156 RepID=UPI00131D6907|nr:response regulator [Defluviitalea raffinosedens]MBM7686309.1 two-component system response regulator YesN [Defluviitalea raffinosedens]HHW67838.1 response regulator [Candidatus Epulonipiscium sp.]
MHKILIADDEQIVLDSLQFVIGKNFKDAEIVSSVYSGKEAIEDADKYRPDIVIMDIKMPGINGIEAIEEIKKSNPDTKFILLTAFDKFDYAKQAINLGVSEYLLKPVNKTKIVQTLKKVMDEIDLEREKKNKELEIREKMEIILPMLENGFIYSVIFPDDHSTEIMNYKTLMGIHSGGYIMTIELGEASGDRMNNKIGVSVKAHQFYSFIRDTLKSITDCIVGAMMLNRIVVFIPYDEKENEYSERLYSLELGELIYKKLNEKIKDIDFKIGIGSNYKDLTMLSNSYNESLQAIKSMNDVGIMHFKDIPEIHELIDHNLLLLEKQLGEKIIQGDIPGGIKIFNDFFNRLTILYGNSPLTIKNKVLEQIFKVSHYIQNNNQENMIQNNRNYFEEILSIEDYEEIRQWSIGQITFISEEIKRMKENKISDVTRKAKAFINENFAKDIKLEDVSKAVNISPYYFSKLFKEETGENFIDYLTSVRIRHACNQFKNKEISIKEVSYDCGYSDPNYFCRIFKKVTGLTPTEYKERNGSWLYED